MVFVLRIQLMGEQARGLADDEFRPGPPRHHERLERILRTLSLAKPDRSKSIFKSGFFLCYYDDEHGVRLACNFCFSCMALYGNGPGLSHHLERFAWQYAELG